MTKTTQLYQWAERSQVRTAKKYQLTRSRLSLWYFVFLGGICTCVETKDKIPEDLSRWYRLFFYFEVLVAETKKVPLLLKLMREMPPEKMDKFIGFLENCVAQHVTT